jgi:Ran GTPase-activating protein (RanGAP) involved in mRNA processing and transport
LLYVKNAFQYGIYNLAEALKMNHTLRHLKLENNGICSMGAMYLADAIRVNNTLEELILGFNSIDSTGFDYLAEALKTNTRLSCLGLSNNCTDVSRFMDILELNNVSIRTLYLNQCYDRANQLCLRNTTIRQNI